MSDAGHNFAYSIPYFIVACVLFVFAYFEEHGKRKDLPPIMAFVFALVFLGFRGYIFTDWISYSIYFRDLPTLFDIFGKLNFNGYEPLFNIYASTLKTIIPDFHVFVFVDSVFDLLLFYKFIEKYQVNKCLAMLVFLFLGGFNLVINLFRNSKALLIFINSLPFIKQKKILPYMVLNIIGCLFHISALIFIPLYFVLDRKLHERTLILIFIIGFLFYILRIDPFRELIVFTLHIVGGRIEVLGNIYLGRGGSFSVAQVFSLGFIERAITMIVLIRQYRSIAEERPDILPIANAFVVFFIIAFCFSTIRIIPERIGSMFLFSYWVLLPFFVRNAKRKNKRLAMKVVFILCLIKAQAYNTIFVKYDNVLFGIESYRSREITFVQYSNLIQ